MTGLAPSSSMFLAGRVVTGCGAAGLWTSVQVLLVQIAPVKRRGLLVGTMNAVITCGSSLGGVIGGAFAASRYGWVSGLLQQSKSSPETSRSDLPSLFRYPSR